MSKSATHEALVGEMKRYVRFTDDDARRLAAMKATVAPSFHRIAVAFYDRIREHEDAHAVFTGEEQIQRLQSSLVVWLERVFGGVYDRTYFAKTEHIGIVHVRVGLPQRYVIAAMSQIRGSLFDLIASPEDRDALARLLDIELAIMLEAYRTDALARLERESSKSGVQAEEVAENAPVFIVGLDEDGKVFLFNGAIEEFSGWGRDEIRGQRFVDVLVPSGAREAASTRFARDGVFETEMAVRSGKRRITRWRTGFVPAACEGKGAYFAFGADVTDEVQERASEAQRIRLEAAGTLVAGLAHAVRNPLNGAGLHLALVERAVSKSGPAETLDAVRVAGAELRRLGTLVTDFLDFARPKPLLRAPVDARTICERAVSATREDATKKAVTLTSDLPAKALMLDADAGRLEQVLVHLIDNAIDAAGDHGTVVVRARREPRHVWIEVEDSGPGLPDPNAPIFDAFYSTKPEGTGLGLAIVHRVVAEHDGEINVDSESGRTRFRLRLPLSREGLVL